MPFFMALFTEQTFSYPFEFLHLYSLVLKVVMNLWHIFAPQCILTTILCIVSACGVDTTEQVNWLQKTVTPVILCHMQYWIHHMSSCVVDFLYDCGDCGCSHCLYRFKLILLLTVLCAKKKFFTLNFITYTKRMSDPIYVYQPIYLHLHSQVLHVCHTHCSHSHPLILIFSKRGLGKCKTMGEVKAIKSKKWRQGKWFVDVNSKVKWSEGLIGKVGEEKKIK